MLSGLIDSVLGSTSERLPRDLVLAIERASVMGRSDDDSGDARILVVAAGLGSFYWEGISPAAQRIARHRPELSPACCRYAARLLAQTVASRNRAEFRHGPKRRSWVLISESRRAEPVAGAGLAVPALPLPCLGGWRTFGA